MPASPIQYLDGGVYLSDLGLWLDPSRPKSGLVFVSHAHSDHTARHQEVVLSLATARLMRERLRGERREHVIPFGETREFKCAGSRFRLTLLPAGHILGSAMALIEARGERLLYTGDFKLRPGQAAEACTPQHADVLIMETTFGRPSYVFPPDDAVWSELAVFCRETLASGENPVLLCYSLGKCQEVMRGLAAQGFAFALHEQACRMTAVYEALGMTFPAYELFDPVRVRGKVVIWPPGAARSTQVSQMTAARRAIISGWALEPSCRYRYRVDAAFPLSDHADFPDLLEVVRQVSPRQVWTLHGYASDFADTLRQLGYDAFALNEADQLTLPLGVGQNLSRGTNRRTR